MNNKGNVMINFLVFIMALGIVIAFLSPITSFLEISQGSNYMNCEGFVSESGTNYSYNSSMNSDSLGCLAIKLYLPYLLLVFLIGGITKILYDKSADFFSQEQ